MFAVNQCARLYLIQLMFLVSLNYIIIFSCAGFHSVLFHKVAYCTRLQPRSNRPYLRAKVCSRLYHTGLCEGIL